MTKCPSLLRRKPETLMVSGKLVLTGGTEWQVCTAHPHQNENQDPYKFQCLVSIPRKSVSEPLDGEYKARGPERASPPQVVRLVWTHSVTVYCFIGVDGEGGDNAVGVGWGGQGDGREKPSQSKGSKERKQCGRKQGSWQTANHFPKRTWLMGENFSLLLWSRNWFPVLVVASTL